MKPQPPHSDAAHAAISRELVRVTLTGADRPELRGTFILSRREKKAMS